MAEYRPVPEDRASDFRRIARYAFGADGGPYDPEEPLDDRQRRMYEFAEDRGMYDGEDLLVVCAHFPFTVRVRGTWLPMGGVSAVASPPEHRRQGLVGEMMAASLAEYRDRGWPLATLRPFDEAFYARYGWATGVRRHVATVDVDALATTQDAAAGAFRRVDPSEAPGAFDDVFTQWLEGYGLATDRTDEWWRDRVTQRFQAPLYCYAWERDDDVRGYLLYEVEDGTIETREFAHADHEAYLNLLRFCHDHDSQVASVRLRGPDHGRLLDVVADRGAVDLEERAGQMVRIVDVPAALSAVEYPGVADARVTLAVADDHAPWNEATFAVAVEDGSARVTETDARPDATVDVGTLSQLLVGYHGVESARRVGDLAVADEAAAATLERLFPERPTFLPESF
jgi:predicted acetyltransferase